MTLQLLSVSNLYLITWLPTIVVGLLQQVSSSDFLFQIQENYVTDLTYLICLFLPWVCLGQIPEINKWIWKQSIFNLYLLYKFSHNLFIYFFLILFKRLKLKATIKKNNHFFTCILIIYCNKTNLFT
jgi:hypothetical protein